MLGIGRAEDDVARADVRDPRHAVELDLALEDDDRLVLAGVGVRGDGLIGLRAVISPRRPRWPVSAAVTIPRLTERGFWVMGPSSGPRIRMPSSSRMSSLPLIP